MKLNHSSGCHIRYNYHDTQNSIESEWQEMTRIILGKSNLYAQINTDVFFMPSNKDSSPCASNLLAKLTKED